MCGKILESARYIQIFNKSLFILCHDIVTIDIWHFILFTVVFSLAEVTRSAESSFFVLRIRGPISESLTALENCYDAVNSDIKVQVSLNLGQVIVITTPNRLVGLVVKASTSRVEDPGFKSRLCRDFFGVEP